MSCILLLRTAATYEVDFLAIRMAASINNSIDFYTFSGVTGAGGGVRGGTTQRSQKLRQGVSAVQRASNATCTYGRQVNFSDWCGRAAPLLNFDASRRGEKRAASLFSGENAIKMQGASRSGEEREEPG